MNATDVLFVIADSALRPRSTFSTATQRAFSLTEVAMAIAVCAFALSGLIALIPTGLNTFRASMDASTAAQIFQRVVSEAQETDFDVLIAGEDSAAEGFYLLPKRYFDDQGNEVKVEDTNAPTPQERSKIIYEVKVRGSKPGKRDPSQHGSEAFTSLPSSDGERYNPRDLTYLTIQIANNSEDREIELDSSDPDLWESSDGRGGKVPVYTYSAIIARNGYLFTNQGGT